MLCVMFDYYSINEYISSIYSVLHNKKCNASAYFYVQKNTFYL
ncbi:hypothetical protein XIS1_400013 [Xenorhabdus innexi]|uniref:Uncharacterized protein n=1 Tax=Xenorhabdus innexi TaxID=290109 RepID=A0A1N6MXV2_9GAMM|nr:hypothetical protein XIS1_400013 [Xenorhabdus innexi]